MFYALFEAGLAADMAANLRRLIFSEKCQSLKLKCQIIGGEIKNSISTIQQRLLIRLKQYGVCKQAEEKQFVKKIDSALEYIQQQKVKASSSLEDMQTSLTKDRLTEILTRLGFQDETISKEYLQGTKIDFIGASNLKTICIDLMELKQCADAGNIDNIDFETLFNAVSEVRLDAWMHSSAKDSMGIIAEHPEIVSQVRNLYNEKIKDKDPNSSNLFSGDRDITCPILINGLIADVLDLVFINEKDSFMRANNLKFAAKVIGKSILLINVDNADGKPNCTLFSHSVGEISVTCAINANGEICKTTDSSQISLDDVFVIAKTGVHFFGPPSFRDYERQLSIHGKYISGISKGGNALIFTKISEVERGKDVSDDKFAFKETQMSKESVEAVVKGAEGIKLSYMSPRIDKVWRYIHTSKDGDVIRALMTTHLAIALPHATINYKSLEARECMVLNTTVDLNRTTECDSCISIAPRKSTDEKLITFLEPANERKRKGAKQVADKEQEQERSIIEQIDLRGVVVFAEMQQKKVPNKILQRKLVEMEQKKTKNSQKKIRLLVVNLKKLKSETKRKNLKSGNK
jgi:hypothetical protein